MSTIFLNSSIDFYEKDLNDNRISHNFGNKNNILDNFKKYIKKYDNFLFVASSECDYVTTDKYYLATKGSFDLTLPFQNYKLLDGRNMSDAEALVKEADFIYLCGGHVPSQNKFFKKIKLKSLLEGIDAVICGQSAGSMNCAEIVYCPPEYEEEVINHNFRKYFQGLGLTNINIFPHYDTLKDGYIMNLHQIEDIVKPDSFTSDIIAIPDGSYILINDFQIELWGEGYLISKGTITQLCEENKVYDLQ